VKIKTKSLPHQEEAFNRFKDNQIVALNSDMGVGKSKIAIDIFDYKHDNGLLDTVLIVAPSGVHAQWLNEQYPSHCSTELYKTLVYSSSKTLGNLRNIDTFMFSRKQIDGLFVFSMNVEAFAKEQGLQLAKMFLNGAKLGVGLIIDEASIIKTPDIKTVKNIKKLRAQYPDSFRITITGTPAAKGPVNTWSVYDFLKPNYMGCSYIAFKKRHTYTFQRMLRIKNRLTRIENDLTEDIFNKVKANIALNEKNGPLDEYTIEVIKDKFGIGTGTFYHIKNSEQFSKYKNIPQLLEKIAPITFSVSKKDCLELPPKVYETKIFELSSQQKKLIKSLIKNSVALYGDKLLTIEMKALLSMRVLQICGGHFSYNTDIEGEFDFVKIDGKNAKLDFLKREIEEIGTQQSIIWAVYTPEVDLLVETLSKQFSVGKLNGSVKDDDRVQVVEDFKSGRVQHLVSQIQVGAFGYNFQNASAQYWYSRNYRTELRIQAEDRNYRIGTVESPIIKDLLYNCKIEQDVYKTLKGEQKINDIFISKSPEELFKIN